MKRDRLKALISLLDDPDDMVFEMVEQELLKESHSIIPVLEKKWENSYDEVSQERIENLIQDLQFKKTKSVLLNWLSSPTPDLLNGFLIVDRFQYPDLNTMAVHLKLDKIRNEVWLELNDSLTILEKITVLNHFIFKTFNFSINHNNLQSPQNCYINQLLDTKKGNKFSLSVFYTVIARRLGLPAHFIDFPKNPLVAIVDRDLAIKVHGLKTRSDVLFYINPSNKGSIASRKEVDYHLKHNSYLPKQKYSEPQSDILFIQRLLESLMEAFKSVGFTEKKERVNEMLKLF